MAANILLDYAFKFTEKTGIQKADLSYLKNLAVIVKPKTSGGTATTQDVTSETQAKTYTDAESLGAFFSGGLNKITLILSDTLTDAETLLDHTKFYTTCIDDAFNGAEIKAFNPTNYHGIVGAAFGVKADAIAYAATEKRCAFIDAATYTTFGLNFAFAKLLSGVYWRDQQYLATSISTIFAVSAIGDAESYFTDGVSFYLNDDQYGKRLGFFGAGGKAITEAYISEEIKRVIQATGVNYLALNQPRNIAISRIRLEDALQEKIDDYGLPPYQYLDLESENDITLTTSSEAFVLNGQLVIDIAEPIWRVKVEALQEAQ